MIVSTTPQLDGKPIREYLGVVTGEAIMGANIVRDLFASVTDIIGGRSGAYEAKLRDGREIALKEMSDEAQRMGANAVVGVDLDYEVVREGMLMISASGTVVRPSDTIRLTTLPTNGSRRPSKVSTDTLPWRPSSAMRLRAAATFAASVSRPWTRYESLK